MSFTADAKQIAEAIMVLQCKVDCRQLTPFSAYFYALSRYGTRAPDKLDANGIREILSYREKADTDLIFAPEMQIKAFAEKYQSELEALLRQISQTSCAPPAR